MNQEQLKAFVQQIVKKANELKNKLTSEKDVKVNYTEHNPSVTVRGQCNSDTSFSSSQALPHILASYQTTLIFYPQ